MDKIRCKDLLSIKKHIMDSEEKLFKSKEELRKDMESFFMREYLIDARAIIRYISLSDNDVIIDVITPELSNNKLERFAEEYQLQPVDVYDWLSNKKEYVFKYIDK